LSPTVSSGPSGTAFGRAAGAARSSLSRIIGFIGLLSLVLVVVGVAALALNERHHLIDTVERDTANHALLLADHASRLFEAADFVIRHAAREIDDMSWEEVERSEALWQHLHDLTVELPYVEAVWLNDSTGELRLSTIDFPTPDSNAADRDFFQVNREPTDKVYVSHRIVGRVTNRPTFLLTRRLSLPDGGFRGIASVTAQIDYFQSFWKEVRLSVTPEVTLFRAEDFDVLAQYPERDDGTFRPVGDAPLRAAVGEAPGFGTVAIARGADGQDRIISYHRVGALPLYLAVSAPRNGIDEAWHQQALIYAGIGAAAVLALAGLTAFAFHQARRDAEAQTALRRTVEERTADLTAAKAQLETLFEELNHRVKNNLQVVTSLLRLEAQRIGDPRLRASLDESVQRIQAMALLHQRLSHSVDFSGMSFPAYVTELTQALVESYGAADRIDVTIDCDDIGLSVARATPLALVINEVVSNALKYAFPGGRRGRVQVSLKQEEGAFVLTVSDDGIGFPPELEWRKAGGLGLRIVRALAAQLGGTPEFTGTGGTRFSLRFPLESETDYSA
jgi:two-component system, sensor histidine kinase PdtaS